MNRDDVELHRHGHGGEPYAAPYYFERPNCLYRVFGDGGALLYIGCSASLMSRLSTHATMKVWWWLVETITVERFPTKAAARAAETEAIRTERPRYNVTHNKRRRVAS